MREYIQNQGGRNALLKFCCELSFYSAVVQPCFVWEAIYIVDKLGIVKYTMWLTLDLFNKYIE